MRASFIVALTLALPLAGCGGGDSSTTGGSGSGSGSGSGTNSGAGSTGSGSDNPCDPANQSSCTIAKTVQSDCVALADYSGASVTTLRMAQLKILKPDALVGGIVQESVVDPAVTINLPQCNFGDDSASSVSGNFNWLLQFDLKNKKLKTGGAKPVPDPLKGYSFATQKISDFEVSAVELDLSLPGDGSFAVAKGVDLIVPIYQDKQAQTVIVLPLHQARILNGKLSSNNNCIGSLDVADLLPSANCKNLPEPYNAAGNLDGYISLEEADKVQIKMIGASLCVVIAGEIGMATCKRTNGKIDFKGDWCSTTNTAGGCQDSARLQGTFAAAAVKVNN